MVPEDMEIQLYSTGHRMTREFIEKIGGSRVTRCIISLDHYKPDIINKRRNFCNAHDEVMQALGLLGNSPLFTAVSMCMTDDLCSEDALRRYIDLACRFDIDEIRVILPVPQGKLGGGETTRGSM
ncbi:hypothetical protein EG829_25865 [bacterium]|nr:hypothetical protein [bacterium]